MIRVMVGAPVYWPEGSLRATVAETWAYHLVAAIKKCPEVDAHVALVVDSGTWTRKLVEVEEIFNGANLGVRWIEVRDFDAEHMAENRPQRRDLGRRGYRRMAFLRNLLVERCQYELCDYLWSVDADVLVPPVTLKALLDEARPQVSAVVCNTAPPDDPFAWNIMDFTADRVVATHIEPEPTGGPCDITGACCLYATEMFAAGVRWIYDPQGEDVGFARLADQRFHRLRAWYVPVPGVQHIMTRDAWKAWTWKSHCEALVVPKKTEKESTAP